VHRPVRRRLQGGGQQAGGGGAVRGNPAGVQHPAIDHELRRSKLAGHDGPPGRDCVDRDRRARGRAQAPLIPRRNLVFPARGRTGRL
ncbi:MAG: hypothetical protein AVDCRST_MAG89-4577, partial [uncultured Gemmatimonadetes bacterium]